MNTLQWYFHQVSSSYDIVSSTAAWSCDLNLWPLETRCSSAVIVVNPPSNLITPWPSILELHRSNLNALATQGRYRVLYITWLETRHLVLLDTRISLMQLISNSLVSCHQAPCGLRGWKNRPAPLPGRMSYKATKLGSVCHVSQPRFFEHNCCAVN